jgi:hypothetical protein
MKNSSLDLSHLLPISQERPLIEHLLLYYKGKPTHLLSGDTLVWIREKSTLRIARGEIETIDEEQRLLSFGPHNLTETGAFLPLPLNEGGVRDRANVMAIAAGLNVESFDALKVNGEARALAFRFRGRHGKRFEAGCQLRIQIGSSHAKLDYQGRSVPFRIPRPVDQDSATTMIMAMGIAAGHAFDMAAPTSPLVRIYTFREPRHP